MKIIETFKVVKENNTIEVVFREPSNSMYACDPPKPVPDKVWKEVYGVEDGVIALRQTIQGKHKPSTYIPDSIEFF